jgi:SAM-dependent methyltransferase
MKTADKAKYLVWAAARSIAADRTCPACASPETRLVTRKHGVTALYRCHVCSLMFRVPKGSPEDDRRFYEVDYEQGSTTDLPDDTQLDELKRTSFRDIGKDYTDYIAVLRTIGVGPGSVVYDYGSSWGYGSWQFRESGYRVYSYDVARTRARFSEQKLGCRVLPEPTAVPERVDCLFASHVIEHLADPNVLWATALRVLQPNGLVVLVMPNGEPSRASLDRTRYHQQWGRVHPLLLSASSLSWMATRYGFHGASYTSPYELGQIAHELPGDLDGDELLFVGRRGSA